MKADECEKILEEFGFKLAFEGELKEPLRTVKVRSYSLEYHGWYIEVELDHDDERSWMYLVICYEKGNEDARFFIGSDSLDNVKIETDEDSCWIMLPSIPSGFRINRQNQKNPRQR